MFEPLAAATAATPRFLRLDVNGNPVAEGTPHAIVRDTATNLEWCVEYATPKRVTYEAAEKACAKLRDDDHADWRMPTRFELESIIALDRHYPAIDVALFPAAKSDWHWSSSPGASDPACAWVVSFHNGSVYLLSRDNSAFVRAVRTVPALDAAEEYAP